MTTISRGDVEKLELELALESGNFNKQMTAITKQINKSEREFKRAGQGIEGYEKSYVGLDAKIKKSTNQIELYNTKLEKQNDKYKELNSTIDRQKGKLTELESKLGKGSDEWKKQAELVQRNSAKLTKLAGDISKTESNLSRLSSELEEAQNEFSQLDKKTKSVADELANVDEKAALAESEFQRLGSELGRSGQSSSKLRNELSQLENKITSGKNKISIYENAIENLTAELAKSKKTHTNLTTEISKTETSLQQAQTEFGKNSTEAQQLRTKLLSLKDSFNTLEGEIEQNDSQLNRYQTELNQTQTEVNELSRELRQMPFDEVGSKMKNAGQKTKDIGQSFTTGLTLPILAAGTAATVAGTNFDTSMSRLQASAGIAEKTSDSYIKLREKALEMGSATSFSASEAADGLTFLALAGWDVETQIERIEPVLRAAEAGGMDLAIASDKITDSMSSAGVASEDFSKYLDITAQAQRKSNASMEEMLDAYIVAGGIFDSLNIPLEESGALLGILANRGTKGSEAGNALISVFSNLITETGQAGNALTELDISLYDTTGKQRNMVEVLKEMADKLGVAKDGTSSLTEQQEQQYAAMVGGKTQFDTLMKLLNGVSDEYDKLKGHLDNSNGALNEMAKIMKDNLGGKIDNMKSAIEGALIKAFESMLPVLEKVVGLITDAANWFSSLEEEQQDTIITVAAVVAAIGPLLIGLGFLIIIGGNAVTLFGALSAGATATSGALALLTGPVGIGIAIVAFGLLVTAVGDSSNSILWLQEKFGGLGYVIGAVCEFISGSVQLTFGNLIIAIMGVCDIIAALLDGPGGLTVSDAWDRLHNKLTLNTEEAMLKIGNTTTRGMSHMRAMSEQELGYMVQSCDILMSQIPTIADGNYSDASFKIATWLTQMSSSQLTSLTGMNDTTRNMFQGINAGMDVNDAANQVAWNMKQMAAAGKLETSVLNTDISDAMNKFKTTLDSKTKEATNSANTNTKDMSNKVSQNVDDLANTKVDKAAKDIATNIDSATKDASQKADTNTNNMANKVDTNSNDMKNEAVDNANTMKSQVTSATSTMASNAINDWNRIRNAYSRSISGSVNITKTTTNVVKSIDNNQEAIRNIPNSIPRINSQDFQLEGAYYSSVSKESVNVTENTINMDLRRLERQLANKKDNETNININLNFDKIEIKNNDSYEDFSKKIVKTIDVELNKLKNKNKSIRGGNIYA